MTRKKLAIGKAGPPSVKHGFVSNGIFRASDVKFAVKKAVLEQVVLQDSSTALSVPFQQSSTVLIY
jgi:hypothetical protein